MDKNTNANLNSAKWLSDYDVNIEIDEYVHHVCSCCRTPALFSYTYHEEYDYGFDDELIFCGIVCDGISEHITDYCPSCGTKMDIDSAMHKIYGCKSCKYYQYQYRDYCRGCGDYPWSSYAEDAPSKWEWNKKEDHKNA